MGPGGGVRPLRRPGMVSLMQRGRQSDSPPRGSLTGLSRERGAESRKFNRPDRGFELGSQAALLQGCGDTSGARSWLTAHRNERKSVATAQPTATGGGWARSALSPAPQAVGGGHAAVHTPPPESTGPLAPQCRKPAVGRPAAGMGGCPPDCGRYTHRVPLPPQTCNLRGAPCPLQTSLRWPPAKE